MVKNVKMQDIRMYLSIKCFTPQIDFLPIAEMYGKF